VALALLIVVVADGLLGVVLLFAWLRLGAELRELNERLVSPKPSPPDREGG